MSALAAALVDSLGRKHLARPAERLAPYLPTAEEPAHDQWLTTKQAADYLGLTTGAIHHYTAAQAIPFERDTPGASAGSSRANSTRGGGASTPPGR